jgi:hypothetical protein
VCPVLDRLEITYGKERALVACTAGDFQLGCVALEDDPGKPLALIVLKASDWRVIGRFEWFPDASRAIGPLLDERWEQVPVDRDGQPSPILVIPCEHAFEVVYRTAAGVRDGRELIDVPGWLDHVDQIWADFRSATSELADWAEHTP